MCSVLVFLLSASHVSVLGISLHMHPGHMCCLDLEFSTIRTLAEPDILVAGFLLCCNSINKDFS